MVYGISTLWALCITIAIAQCGYSVAQNHQNHHHHHNAEELQRQTRIINGTEALPGTAKYQVSIRDRKLDAELFGSGHVCAGTLISENVVLTTGKCFVDKDNRNGSYLPDNLFNVVVGNFNLNVKDSNTLVFDIVKSIKYVKVDNLYSYDDNLAIVILNGVVPANHPTAKPITLNGGRLKSGTVCQFTGWGATGTADSPPQLRTVNLPIIAFDVCKTIDNGLRLSLGMLCAGYTHGQTGACPGDTGGPLVCNDLQAGIASFSNACNRADRPTGFTDVAYYKDWILSTVKANKGTEPKFEGTITGNGGSTGGGTGSGSGDGQGDGAMSICKNSMLVAVAMVAFNVIVNMF